MNSTITAHPIFNLYSLLSEQDLLEHSSYTLAFTILFSALCLLGFLIGIQAGYQKTPGLRR